MRKCRVEVGFTALMLVAGCGGESSGGGEDVQRTAVGSKEPTQSLNEEASGDPCDSQPLCVWWSGSLISEGKVWELDSLEPAVDVRHCHEEEERGVTVGLSIPKEEVPGSLDRILLRIGGQLDQITLGDSIPLKKEKRRHDMPARALAYLSPEGRAASAHLPEIGTLQFDAVSRGGELDLSFTLDFGSLGRAEGRVRSPVTLPQVCLIPEGPQTAPVPVAPQPQ